MSMIQNEFGCMVFGDAEMRQRLPKEIYRSLRKTIETGCELDHGVSGVVASAMKDWALEKGATHYTHWFQPMTGITAEKHDSFLCPTGDGEAIAEFSSKDLKRGEPDASSFPSGGLRTTFEARGYTAWDPTSYAFIKDKTLCVPTAFFSYGGEALDKKTPLLRSMEAVNIQALRILRLFGNTTTKRVITTVGPEQEYFLVDKDIHDKRKDLVYTGRTLYGAMPPKGQELEDHYFGTIKPRVKAYMEDLNNELWHLGVYAKTEHNEAAPAQHELAPVFTNTNIATDHNQLTMEIMKKVALRNGLVCILHEKPFAGVNGSGKHNNWSLATDDGINLLEPGDTPYENAQFLLFLAAVIAGVDEYQDLLRVSAASAGNDHRLGASEAPPAILSIFLGDQLTGVLDAIENENEYENMQKTKMRVGVTVLPAFSKDLTDRNRTSPFAFTGNKFEFRMLGSAFSIAESNIILNTIAAEQLSRFADRLESAESFTDELHQIIKTTIKDHKRIIFNGNNYTDAWEKEAEKRGLSNLKTTADALPHFKTEKSIALFEKHRIFTRTEVMSRYEILVENYCKVLNIEALTMIDMARKNIIPACEKYAGMIAKTAANMKTVGISVEAETTALTRLSGLLLSMYRQTETLEKVSNGMKKFADNTELSCYCRDTLIPAMNSLREVADELETIVGEEYWPYPTYGSLLFGVC
ncbi:MAG: glutamine synthetase III [Clostridia bacterium]|nr:glutamine synthetase III [Clostridia bacterium]